MQVSKGLCTNDVEAFFGLPPFVQMSYPSGRSKDCIPPPFQITNFLYESLENRHFFLKIQNDLYPLPLSLIQSFKRPFNNYVDTGDKGCHHGWIYGAEGWPSVKKVTEDKKCFLNDPKGGEVWNFGYHYGRKGQKSKKKFNVIIEWPLWKRNRFERMNVI